MGNLRFDYKKGDFEAIKNNLALTNWTLFFSHCESVDDMYSCFLEYLYFLRSTFVPQFEPKTDSKVMSVFCVW